MAGNERLLLIDTCGVTAGMALCEGCKVLASADLSERQASAEILGSLRHLLAQPGWRLTELSAIGVVAGPGSFTGVRTGLAFAKGLSESAGLRMVSVSRLEVLADAARVVAAGDGPAPALAVLDAGRDQVYAREVSSGREWLTTVDALLGACQSGKSVAVVEQRLADRLQGCRVLLCSLHAGDALGGVLRRLQGGGSDVEDDANYLRQEADIYRSPVEARSMATATAGLP
ncbi:MAG: tRNA (adenosine(37)-N6)-threonylcarbamoyltransferase complex dimerization subunit type 1 TsaB [Acidobacteriaceae bacterium]